MSSPTVYVVTVLSAYRECQCLLGSGPTKADAMADAYGPKPWPKSARLADCYEVTEDELQAMREDASS